MKHILLATAILLLTACHPNDAPSVNQDAPRDYTDEYILPEDLSDCKVYRITGKNMAYLYVMRCGNSVTTKTGGKFQKHATLIEE